MMKERFFKIMGMACLFFLFTGCAGGLKSSAHSEVNLSAWTAYWDMEKGMKEYKDIHNQLSSLSYFAASFREDGHLVVPEEVQSAKKKTKNASVQSYLTFVNDLTKPDGKSVEKDLGVLRQVLADDAVMDQHIAEIISLTEQGKYDGIEIDYEGEWKDADLFAKYLDFTYKLTTAAIHHQLKLRIVLEPSVPFDAGFCQGPQYVVMLYNLYGTHSGPGPKANRAFIQKVINKMQSLPGDKAAAFSTGGCVWENVSLLGSANGKKHFIDEVEAKRLETKYKASPQRDADSACLHFDYDEKGQHYEVWYADSETLNAWITVAADQGIQNISLWRLGSNTDIDQVRRKIE